jgi:hypothetical protein
VLWIGMRNTTGTDKETASEISSKRKTEYDILILGLAILAGPFSILISTEPGSLMRFEYADSLPRDFYVGCIIEDFAKKISCSLGGMD